jgi:hypothetical protein
MLVGVDSDLGGSSRFFVCLCCPDMVPNQRQLFIVVSDWGLYLGSHFLICVCGILSTDSCLCAPAAFRLCLFVLIY